MDAAGPSPALELVIKPGNNSVDILVSGVWGGDDLRSEEKWQELSGITGRLGGGVNVDQIDTGFTIRLNLPAHPKAGA